MLPFDWNSSSVRNMRRGVGKPPLAKWREMVGSTIEEMTRGWMERVLVSDMEVSASFLDGKLFLDFKSMPPHMLLRGQSVRQHMTKLICESLN